MSKASDDENKRSPLFCDAWNGSIGSGLRTWLADTVRPVKCAVRTFYTLVLVAMISHTGDVVYLQCWCRP